MSAADGGGGGGGGVGSPLESEAMEMNLSVADKFPWRGNVNQEKDKNKEKQIEAQEKGDELQSQPISHLSSLISGLIPYQKVLFLERGQQLRSCRRVSAGGRILSPNERSDSGVRI